MRITNLSVTQETTIKIDKHLLNSGCSSWFRFRIVPNHLRYTNQRHTRDGLPFPYMGPTGLYDWGWTSAHWPHSLCGFANTPCEQLQWAEVGRLVFSPSNFFICPNMAAESHSHLMMQLVLFGNIWHHEIKLQCGWPCLQFETVAGFCLWMAPGISRPCSWASHLISLLATLQLKKSLSVLASCADSILARTNKKLSQACRLWCFCGFKKICGEEFPNMF